MVVDERRCYQRCYSPDFSKMHLSNVGQVACKGVGPARSSKWVALVLARSRPRIRHYGVIDGQHRIESPMANPHDFGVIRCL